MRPTAHGSEAVAASPDSGVDTPLEKGKRTMSTHQRFGSVGDSDPADVPSADAESEIVVHRDDPRRSYAASLGSVEVATIEFKQIHDRVVVLSTHVVPEFRGRGIAGELIAYALDDVRDRDLHVTVYCPLVSAFINQNPEYADLVDLEHPGRAISERHVVEGRTS